MERILKLAVLSSLALVGAVALACSGGSEDDDEPIQRFNGISKVFEVVADTSHLCAQPGGVSRDGRRIALVRGSQISHDAPCEYHAVAVVDVPSGDVRDVTPVGWWPTWSPDGETLVLEEQSAQGAWCERTASLVDVESGNRRVLKEPLYSIEGFSPDGKHVLLTYCRLGHTDKRESIVVNLDGEIVKNLGAIAIAWTSEGDIVVHEESAMRFKIVSLAHDDPVPIATPVSVIDHEQHPWETRLEPCDDVIDPHEICY
jgi:hypothetical protein